LYERASLDFRDLEMFHQQSLLRFYLLVLGSRSPNV
jgi:hypothetical protein